jgi:hypothetical protein
MTLRIPKLTVWAVGLTLLGSVGCDEARVSVEGRLRINGRPPTADDGEPMIVFHPAGPQGNPGNHTYVAEVRPDGTYLVEGRKKTGVPYDRYQVTVELGKDYTDRLQGAYDVGKTPFTFDVSSDYRVFDLDVKLPAGPAGK